MSQRVGSLAGSRDCALGSGVRREVSPQSLGLVEKEPNPSSPGLGDPEHLT